MITDDRRKDELLAVEKAWGDAHRALDVDTIEDILSDQYRQVQPGGKVIGKKELLASYRSGQRRWEIAESDQHEVRILGKSAILIGRWRGKGENAGKPFDYQARFLAVYQLEDGAWKLISDISVPIED